MQNYLGKKASTDVECLFLTLQLWVRFRAFPKNFRGEFINVAEVNLAKGKCPLWLENADRTHLVLASGRPVLKKL